MLEGYQEYSVEDIFTAEQPLKRSFTPTVYEPKNTGLKLYILRGIAGSGKYVVFFISHSKFRKLDLHLPKLW